MESSKLVNGGPASNPDTSESRLFNNNNNNHSAKMSATANNNNNSSSHNHNNNNNVDNILNGDKNEVSLRFSGSPRSKLF